MSTLESSSAPLVRSRLRGFTIVELLIVIVVIGILAALVLTSVLGAQARARETKRITDLVSTKKQLELYKIENDVYPYANSNSTSTLADVTRELETISRQGMLDPQDNPAKLSYGRYGTSAFCNTDPWLNRDSGACRGYLYLGFGPNAPGLGVMQSNGSGCWLKSKSREASYVLGWYDEKTDSIKYYPSNPNDVEIYKGTDSLKFPNQQCVWSELRPG